MQRTLDIIGIETWMKQEVWDLARHMAFTGLNVAQGLTRVEYGRARSSWGLGSPAAPNHDPGELTEKIPEARASQMAMSHVSGVGKMVPPGGLRTIEVASYVDYMIYLDQGTEYIEPGNMVDSAARAAAESFGNHARVFGE